MKGLHLAVGIFDGIHRGHRSILQAAIGGAKQRGGTALALTFFPHPTQVLIPSRRTPLLWTLPLRLCYLEEWGMKTVLYPFTLRLANRRADTFFRSLKRDLGPIQAIYIGENARFGRGGETDANGLKRLLEPSLTVNIFPSLLHGGKCISSTRIRQALGEGRMEEVNAMLGSPYMVRAWLQSGKRKDLTRFTLGWDPEAKPRFGTYRVRVVSVSTPSLSIEGLAHYGTEATLSPLLDVRLQSPWPSEGEPSPVEIEWIQCLQPGKTFPSMGKKDKETTHSLENSETFPIVSPHFS